MTNSKVDGIKINLGGKEFIVPALNFRQIKAIQNDIRKLENMAGGMVTDEEMQTMAKVVQMALSRNYPEVTEDELLDMLDLRNAPRVVEAIMGISGFEKAQSGEVMAGS